MEADNLPTYRNPPVVETVLGVQFDRLPEFKNAHLGLFWEYLRSEWSKETTGKQTNWCDPGDAAALEPVFERFDDGISWSNIGLALRIDQHPAGRIMIRNADQDRLVQLQNGRLHYNWLGHHGGPYPSYKSVLPEFTCALDVLQTFLNRENLGIIKPNQWEVTYVNRIVRGSVWDSPDDWGALFRTLPQPRSSVVRLESVGGEWHYEIPEKLGRLHVNLSHRHADDRAGAEFLQMTLTARGPVSDDRCADGLLQGLNLGHAVIVQAFTEMTSDDAHLKWERIQ